MLTGETGAPWSYDEIEVVVDEYMRLLSVELHGERPRKTEAVARLRALLPARSTASIERKMQNVSAILDEEQSPWIDGYKPLSHYQRALRDAVLRRIGFGHRLAETLAEYQASTLAAPVPRRPLLEDVLVDRPTGLSRSKYNGIGITAGPVGALRDYRNHQLGTAGEEWVLDLERDSLARAGRPDLAAKISWVARDVGDGAGYDVASFRLDGSPLAIEVKTTNLGYRTPFYVTRWEVQVSERIPSEYSLYRVFDFRSDPHLYRLDSSIPSNSKLEPTVFVGVPA